MADHPPSPEPPSPAVPPQLRPATERDLDGILAIEALSFTNPGEQFSPSQIIGLMENPRARVTVTLAPPAEGSSHGAAPAPRISGWAAGLTRRSVSGKVSGRIYSVATHPGHRGQGVGRALCEDLLTWFAARGATKAYLEVRTDNTPAIQLYRRLGFEEFLTLPDYYGPGIDGLRMRATIDPDK